MNNWNASFEAGAIPAWSFRLDTLGPLPGADPGVFVGAPRGRSSTPGLPLAEAYLGSDAFVVRTKADQTLQKLGTAAEPDLRKALQGTSLESRRRIEVLLDRIVNHDLTAEELRHARAVEVLQTIASPEARALLTRWAGGDASAILSVEARKAGTLIEGAMWRHFDLRRVCNPSRQSAASASLVTRPQVRY